MASKTTRLLRSMKEPRIRATNAFPDMVLPNKSGDHQGSIRRLAPTADMDLTNRKYVDDKIKNLDYSTATWHDNMDAATMNVLDDQFIIQAQAIATNSSHATSGGNSHATVVLNQIHRTGDGSGHADVAANTLKDSSMWETKDATTNQFKVAKYIDMLNQGMFNLSDPATAQGAATKQYVDDNDHAESHNIASHSDTSATGAELNSLTDNSMVNTLHRHSELVASDGSPDPAVNVNGTGIVTMGYQSRINVGRNAAQSIPNATFTDVVFNAESFDAQGEHNTGNGIFTAAISGYYIACWAVLLGSPLWPAGKIFQASLSKNNSTADGSFWRGIRWLAQTGHTGYASSVGSAIVYLAAGNTLRIKCFHNQGGAVNVTGQTSQTYFHIHKLS